MQEFRQPLVANFFCQNCGQPVKLEASLLDHRSVDEALGPLAITDSHKSSKSTQSRPSLSVHPRQGLAPVAEETQSQSQSQSQSQPTSLMAAQLPDWATRNLNALRRSSFPSRPLLAQPSAAAPSGGPIPSSASQSQQTNSTRPIAATPPESLARIIPQPSIHAAGAQSQIQDSFIVLASPSLANHPPASATTIDSLPSTTTSAASASTASAASAQILVSAPHNQLPQHSTQAHQGQSASSLSLSLPEDHRGNLSHRLKVASKLFDIVSGVDETDHPLCLECADELMLKLERTLSEAKAEHSTYAEYLATLTEQIKANERSNSVDSSITDEDIEELKRREESAISVLCDLERESQDLQQELYQAEAELAQTEALEQEYWQQVNTLERELASYQNQLESINLKYEHVTKRLNELTKTNAYSDTFRIWHDGLFGTINGLRLGRLQSHPVEWSEINAAIGQTVLLLDTLANKLGFTFANYRLIPMGSFSRIERTDGDKSVYELYGSSDIAGVLFWNRRFDFGLVAFLNCLQQLGDFAEQQDPRFRLPYRINKDKIGDVPIRLQFNLDESWTKALKYTLIDVKWMLAFCCSRLEP